MDYDFDEMQAKLEKNNQPSGKRHPGYHGKKTSNFIKNDFVQHTHDLRVNKAKKNLEKVILDFPQYEENEDLRNRFLDRYIGWVKESLKHGKLIFRPEKDIELEFSRSSSHGGQNVNKVESAVRVVHTISQIAVHNEETRDQVENRERATQLLKKKLSEHLNDWSIVVDGKEIESLSRYDVLEIPQNHLTF